MNRRGMAIAIIGRQAIDEEAWQRLTTDCQSMHGTPLRVCYVTPIFRTENLIDADVIVANHDLASLILRSVAVLFCLVVTSLFLFLMKGITYPIRPCSIFSRIRAYRARALVAGNYKNTGDRSANFTRRSRCAIGTVTLA